MLDFPNTPAVGATFPDPPVAGLPVWRWDGDRWVTVGRADAPTDGNTYARRDGQWEVLQTPDEVPETRVLLASQTVTSPIASVDFFYNFTNVYDQYKLDIYNLRNDTASSPQIRLSRDGVTFDAGTNYAQARLGSDIYATQATGIGAVNATSIPLTHAQVQVTSFTEMVSDIEIYFSLPWTTDRIKRFYYRSLFQMVASGLALTVGSGGFVTTITDQLRGIRIYMSAGQITSGVFNMFGIVKTGAGAP